MKDIFRFPDKFKVKKELGKERFLTSANLTDSEKDTLAHYIKNVQIQYDIVLPDNSEVVVLGVDVRVLQDKFTPYNIALLVSKSVPYESLIVLYYYEFIYMYSFNMREHKTAIGKRVLNNFSIHGRFMSDDMNKVSKISSLLNKSLKFAKNASDLAGMWRQNLNSMTGKSNFIS